LKVSSISQFSELLLRVQKKLSDVAVAQRAVSQSEA